MHVFDEAKRGEQEQPQIDAHHRHAPLPRLRLDLGHERRTGKQGNPQTRLVKGGKRLLGPQRAERTFCCGSSASSSSAVGGLYALSTAMDGCERKANQPSAKSAQPTGRKCGETYLDQFADGVRIDAALARILQRETEKEKHNKPAGECKHKGSRHPSPPPADMQRHARTFQSGRSKWRNAYRHRVRRRGLPAPLPNSARNAGRSSSGRAGSACSASGAVTQPSEPAASIWSISAARC